MRSPITSERLLRGISFILSCAILIIVMVLFASCNEELPPDSGSGKTASATSFISGMHFREGEVIVKFREGVSFSDKIDVHRRLNASIKRTYRHFPWIHVVRLPDGMTVEDAVGQYLKSPHVEYAEPNYIRKPLLSPDDTLFSQQWGLIKINAPSAWDKITDSSSVVVAVIDTGVYYTHEDIAGNMWVNSGETANGIDDDGNGYIDDIYGINAITGSGDPMDTDGHGTHVSGIIGAVGNNGIGVAGVNWKVKIMALKFMDASGGYLSDELECINYILNMKNRGVNIRVVNGSFGASTFSNAEYDAIKSLKDNGILFVAAAGNDGSNNDSNPTYPASYDLPNIIAVAATDNSDNLASFSNYGISSVDIGAPGVNILSTVPGNNYQRMDGTSMATPFVTGAAAMLSAYLPSYDYIWIKETILSSVDPTTGLNTRVLSGGRLNLFSGLSSPGRPIRPTKLSASAGVGASISLAWIDNSMIEDGFKIERKTGSGSYSEIGNVSANITSYNDTGLSELTKYYYRVSAFNSNGSSNYSNEASATTSINPPTALTATAVSSSQINLSWTDNSMVEDGFKIERKTSSDSYSVIATVGPNITTFSSTGLSPSTTYYFRIRAYRGSVNSAYSNEASATTQTTAGGGGGGGCSVGGDDGDPWDGILFLLIFMIPAFLKRIAFIEKIERWLKV